MRTSRFVALATLFAALSAASVAQNNTNSPQQQTLPIPTPGAGALGASTTTTSAATLRGNVTDPDGAVIPGATITVTPAKGKAIVQQSGQDGSYIVQNIPDGTYSVTVTMPGFSSAVKQGVKFAAGHTVTMNVKLSVEEQNTEVSVTTNANTVSVDPDSNASAVVISGKDLDALSDDPDELSSELSALAGPSAGPNGGQIYVDGFTGGQLPPKSSIREIRVNQNPFSAQYDRPGFGRVEILTKPGTDSFHGSAMVQGNYSAFNTSSPILGSTNQFPSYYTIFGMGSLSGPLSKKASFSVNGSYRNIAENAVISTPSFLSYLLDPSNPNSGYSPDPCVPGDTTNPGCLSYHPFPEAYRAINAPRKRGDISPRLDFALSDTNTLTVRYQYETGSNINGGIGNTALTSQGYNSDSNESVIQISDSQIFGPKVVNETRFEYRRERSSQTPFQTNTPVVSLQGGFTYGGNSAGISSTHDDHYEIQNYTSVLLSKHFLRLGGRLRIEREALASYPNQNGSFNYANLADYNAGHAQQYSLTKVNNGNVRSTFNDVGLYAEDDWKALQNLTFSYGVRYEAQNVINSSYDFAPRLSVAYGIPRKGGQPITVLRGGAGIFYDRFDISNYVTVLQQNGTNQTQSIYKPTAGTVCKPNDLSGCTTGGSGSTAATIYTAAPNLRSEYNMQFAIGVDQQLSKTASLSMNYVNSNGYHMFMDRFLPINIATSQYQYQYQSEGVFHQNQLIATVRWNPSAKYSLFGYYSFSKANSNTNGASYVPTDSTNPKTDYGRSAFNRTNRLFLMGNVNLPYAFSLNPFMIANSGQPYNVTTGTDVNGDFQFNDRATFAPGRTSGNCLVASDFADPLSTNGNVPTNNYARIPSNYCTGPAMFTMNLRVAKSFGFGEKNKNANATQGGRQGGGPGGPGGPGGGGRRGGGGGGGGPMMMGGGAPSNHKYNFTLSAQAFNLFNMVPYSVPQANLSNPTSFGKSLSLVPSGFGGGGSSASASAAVRRIFLQMSFNF